MGECTDGCPPTFQLFSGQVLVVSGSSTTTFNMGEIYGFYYQFDSELQSPDAASITVTLYNGIEPVSINAKGNEGPVSASESTKANSAFYAFSGNVSFSSGTVNIDPIVVFDNEYIIVTPVYWVKQESSDEKQKEELAKHASPNKIGRAHV